ncbi:MAG: hypothetical protein AAGA68_16755 [Pseudomonadota bacterium]
MIEIHEQWRAFLDKTYDFQLKSELPGRKLTTRCGRLDKHDAALELIRAEISNGAIPTGYSGG